MPTSTTRLGLLQPTVGDTVAELRLADTNNTNTLDNSVLFFSGTLASRASVVTPLVAGVVYHATDTGLYYVYDGASWSVGTSPTSRGATNVSTSQSVSSTSYTTLGTPDQVTGLVLPTNGQIVVSYQATWQSSVSDAARAAIFIGANQLKVAYAGTGSSSAVTQAAAMDDAGSANTPHILSTSPFGLISPTTGQSYTGDVATGQAVALYGATGGPIFAGLEFNGSVERPVALLAGACTIFAPAGTYTVSIQFKASSGSVTASNRHLWVEAKSFSS